MTQVLSAQADETQKKIQSATQVVIQTQHEVQGLSALARKAEYASQITIAKVEKQLEERTQQVQEQKTQSALEMQAAQKAQAMFAQQLSEAQQVAKSSVTKTQQYEEHISTVTQKMNLLKVLLVAQRQKGQKLEKELSTTQDQIGGAESRAQ